MRNRALLAFILLFADGIMGRHNMLFALKAPEGPRRKSDIPVLGNAMKSNATGAKKIDEYLLRYHPTYTTHSTVRHCLSFNLACRQHAKCEVKKN
jgi:hypothetical protein